MKNTSVADEARFRAADMVLDPLGDDHFPLLVRELNHRLFNTLQVVMSLAHAAQRSSGDARARDSALLDLNLRLAAFARLHRLLAEPDPWPFEHHCRQLCTELVRAFGREDVTPWVRMADVSLTPDQRSRLSLLVVELVTNSLKHGLRYVEEGVIWIDLTPCAPDGLELAVRDTAVATAPPACRPAIVDALAKSLSGAADILLQGGYSTRVRFPQLAACAAAPQDQRRRGHSHVRT